jgi:hypothetical protein
MEQIMYFYQKPPFLFKLRIVALFSRTLSRLFCSKRRKRRVALRYAKMRSTPQLQGQ